MALRDFGSSWLQKKKTADSARRLRTKNNAPAQLTLTTGRLAWWSSGTRVALLRGVAAGAACDAVAYTIFFPDRRGQHSTGHMQPAKAARTEVLVLGWSQFSWTSVRSSLVSTHPHRICCAQLHLHYHTPGALFLCIYSRQDTRSHPHIIPLHA